MNIHASTSALLLSIAQGAAAAQAATLYDGSWALEIITEKGQCEPLYRYYLVIDGEVVRIRSPMGETATRQQVSFSETDLSTFVWVTRPTL